MRMQSDLEYEADEYFRQMKLDYEAVDCAYKHILTTMDAALAANDYEALSKMIPYIEDGDGRLALRYIGGTHRILRMLNIIALENKYHKIPLYDGCESAESLRNKYMLTLFAFRRLHFRLSNESVSEAVAYLQSHPVSHFAAYMMTQDELLIPESDFYDHLADVYADVWNEADRRQFFALASQS